MPNLDAVAVIVPTLNAQKHFGNLLPALLEQGLPPEQVLVIDSSSEDNTGALARAFGARVHVIPRKEFNHGGTRRMAATLCPNAQILVFLTQDALPAGPDTLVRIAAAFDDPDVAMAYGRQLPRPEARPIERYARLRNYPASSQIRSLSDRTALGITTVFCSDSFAAYRAEDLAAAGSFPADCYFGEDQIVAGQLLLMGRKLAYVAEARVIHSHDYTITQDFKRNFDIGVFHTVNAWLLREFGSAERAGLGFVAAEVSYLLGTAPWVIPSALLRTIVKYFGYRLGRKEARLSTAWKIRLSMQPSYWRSRAG